MAAARAKVTKRGYGLLKRQYYCSVDASENEVKVLMKLNAPTKSDINLLPIRYSLVIDISGSMSSTYTSDPRSLLERIKIFAKILVEKVRSCDSVSLTAFDHEADVLLPMSVMNSANKKIAIDCIQGLCTRGATNLSEGILKGLSACGKGNSDTRDCIILFTDGEANGGIIDGPELVKAYLDLSKKMGRKSCVPISAFTIGWYQPHLLIEVADKLGSDAFYWLNDDIQFEADLLIPMFLRQTTYVTDIKVKFSCLKGVTIKPKKCEKQKKFIHALPQDITKEYQLELDLPKKKLEELNGEKIMEIKIKFLDFNMQKKTLNDYVRLETPSLYGCMLDEEKIIDDKSLFTGDAYKEKFLRNIGFYSMENNKALLKYETAKISMIKLSEFACNKVLYDVLETSRAFLGSDDAESAKNSFGGAIASIEKIQNKVQYIQEFDSVKKLFIDFEEFTNTIKQEIRFAQQICDAEDARNFARLSSMSSSIYTNMPTTSGVFKIGQKQRYMPQSIQSKINEMKKVVVAKKKADGVDIETSSVFKASYFVLSESLREKRLGGKRNETLQELIIRCKGTPVPNVSTMSVNTIMVCSRKDYERRSLLVQDAINTKTPIVKESFVWDSIRKKTIVDIDAYILENKPVKA